MSAVLLHMHLLIAKNVVFFIYTVEKMLKQKKKNTLSCTQNKQTLGRFRRMGNNGGKFL